MRPGSWRRHISFLLFFINGFMQSRVTHKAKYSAIQMDKNERNSCTRNYQHTNIQYFFVKLSTYWILSHIMDVGLFWKTITRRYIWEICKFNHGIQTYIATKFKMNYNQGACWNIWSNVFWKQWCATQDYVEIMKFNTKIVWTIKYKNTIGRKKIDSRHIDA